MSGPFPSERSARFLLPISAMKAPEQMFLDHRKLRSSNRIKLVAVQIAVRDVVEFAHFRDTAPERNVHSSEPFTRGKEALCTSYSTQIAIETTILFGYR